ncbi:EVE domain-containing protein [Candidatus Uhrbacteria bacterium]|nr:EVE domain-containing protein [Candidatus Uhrbacteria bacterium]
MHYWLLKSEPGTYSWNDLVRDKKTSWDGVRNYQARNNMRLMKKGDLGFFYHSVKEKKIIGIVKIIKEAYADPTAKEGDWSMVDIAPVNSLKNPVSLELIKQTASLREMVLVKNSRLSVQSVRNEEWETCVTLANS